MANKNKTENAIFNYKTLKLIMIGFGSFLVAVGPLYAYFIATTVGLENLGDVIWTFIFAVLAGPAGIYICIIGRKMKGPIIKNDDQ